MRKRIIRYDASIIDHKGVSASHTPKEENSVPVSGYSICKADVTEKAEEWNKICGHRQLCD